MKKFWNWIKNETVNKIADSAEPDSGEQSNGNQCQPAGERTLFLDGVIAEESWLDDDVTPEIFRQELFAETGDVTVHINSPGGDCIAASKIYTMLKEYPGHKTVQVDGLAASAATVVAMAGDWITMSPTSLMMVHNPMTSAYGNAQEMQAAIYLLDETKASIINAYQLKTGLSRQELSDIMDDETWMNAYKALELGFCDDVLFDGDEKQQKVGFSFSENKVNQQLVNIAVQKAKDEAGAVDELIADATDVSETKDNPENTNQNRVSVKDTDTRLEYLRY